MATAPSVPPDRNGEPGAVPAPTPVAQVPPPPTSRKRQRLRSFLGLLGPGLISGAANDDPSAIGTSASAGAAFGFSLLWTAPLTFPMMSTTVFLCSKLGMVTNMGIAGVLRKYYSRWLLYPVVIGVLIANILEAGADIGVIAACLRLIVPVPVIGITVAITMIILIIQSWGSYELVQRIFKWLTIALFAYVGAAVLAKPDLSQVLHGTFMPRLQWNRHYLEMLVAIIGARLSPYMYFWQASQEVEEQAVLGHPHLRAAETTDEELNYAKWDVNIGMFFSNLIVYFIILGTAATLYQAGSRNIRSAYEAAQALRPLAGQAATLLFAAGVIGVGILAVPILTTGPAYALAETFGWKHGLDHRPQHAKEFYAVIALSTFVALAIGFSGINPISALLWASMLMGLLAPPLMVIIMMVTSNRKIMGNRVNGMWVNVIGWATTVAISAAAAGLIWSWVAG